MAFKEAVEATPHLKGKWKAGLKALRAQDKPRIKPEDASTTHLRGSVDIDTACRSSDPNGNRWDFAIGYKHTNRANEYIYWVETHTGADNQITVMFRKLNWLKAWLKKDGKDLAKFDSEFVWVPSGRTSFTKGSPQVRKLADQGLFYSGSSFRIPVNHPTPTL